jgi:N6-adenosine-specific RNA methylase IME4
MTIDQIKALPVPDLADTDAHLWLWTTNATLHDGYHLCEAWGFKVLCPIHWIKPSGLGAWWVHRSQTLLHAYRGKLDMRTRLRPNIIEANSRKHSQKPEASYKLIEDISHEARIELFARAARDGWITVGNEVADGEDITTSLSKIIETAL